jgi:hypothetical protein
MAFLKKHLQMILFAAVCLAAAGVAGWGYVAGGDVTDQMQTMNRLRSDLRRHRSDPANLATIEARKKRIEQETADLERTLDEALATQKINAFEGKQRELLVPEVLPQPKSPGDALNFKAAYRRAFAKLAERMRGRDRPLRSEIQAQQVVIDNRNQPPDSRPKNPWMPENPASSDFVSFEKRDNSLASALSESAEARATEIVARSIYMYLDRNAIRPNDMINTDKVPDETQIWHSQMSLWIQQDVATALARVNEKRASELAAAGRQEDAWVAHMPVKRLKVLRIEGWLGRGGGSNGGRFAQSFTGQENDNSRFIVPLQMELIIEEGAMMEVLESLCAVGFYVPIQVQCQQAEIDPLQRDYIYGEDPVTQLTIDLEGYYLRKVFEDWIPKPLKQILATPEARDETQGGRR